MERALPEGVQSRRPAMSKDIKKPAGETRRYVGIDLGDKKSRVCTLDERGEIVLQEWVVTAPEAFFKRFRGDENGHRDGGGYALAMVQRSIGEVRSQGGG